ncbi:MAG: hydrogenase maturation nickel metallochaperone HypA [Acidobacteriaceae bacterium]
MHELSIALSMMEQMEQQALKHGGAVRSVLVRIGDMSGVDCEALRFAWQIAREGTPFTRTELEIEKVPLLVRCSQCGETHEAQMFAIACPRCVTPEQEIVTGRELELRSVEMEI